MVNVLTLLCTGLLAAVGSAPAETTTTTTTTPAETLAEYAAVVAGARPGADEQVRLALWCEEHGLTAERIKHLAGAVVRDPGHPLARGLLGLVKHGRRWLSPEVAGAAMRAEATDVAALAEYNGRRDKLAERTAHEKARFEAMKEQGRYSASPARAARAIAMERLKLGLWCEQKNLGPEANAEFTTAVHLDPHLDDAWKHLGYVRQDGRWMPAAQAEAEVAESLAQGEANGRWQALFVKWKAWLKDEKRRAEAEEQLARVTDPRAVVALGRVFCDERAEDQEWAVRILGAIATPPSSRLLAKLAVYSAFGDIRKSATALLVGRPSSEYAGDLVEMIHGPAKYAIEPVRGPGSPGMMVVDTPRYRLVRKYDAPLAFTVSTGFFGYVGYDANGLPIAIRGREINQIEKELSRGSAGALEQVERRTAEMIAAANLKAVVAQQRLATDVRDLEDANARAAELNTWVGEVLQGTLGAPDLKDDEEGWHRWYFDRVGYSYTPPPRILVTQFVQSIPPPSLASCFVAGTPVKTLDGPRPIEAIRPGDRVLSQDTGTGALGFQPVLAVHANPPGATVRLTLETGEVIIPSTYHRFWIAGRGWAMARDLRPGDALRTLGGRVKVASTEPGAVVPVYNLDVASDHTFFVGDRDYLVHDNTLPGPAVTPFDAPAGAGVASLVGARSPRPGH